MGEIKLYHAIVQRVMCSATQAGGVCFMARFELNDQALWRCFLSFREVDTLSSLPTSGDKRDNI